MILLFCLAILVCGSVFFLLGYILGKLSSQQNIGSQPVSFFKKEKNNQTINESKISIDDTKYVTEISTVGLEKKYQAMGEIKNTNENIESSVSKLKNMKG